jgi:uncharacterized membrane protein YbhN (UPF0104 family)
LLVLYFGAVGAIGLTLLTTLLLCNVHLSVKEILMLTMYSSIINFFGPLQSGPAFRALYLKKKHGLKIKNYTLATFMYYILYALVSGLLLLSGLLKWWLLLIIPAVMLALVWLRYSNVNIAKRLRKFNLKALGLLGLATILQSLLTCLIYFVELHSVDHSISLKQALIYTGAANFALFVSLTPGAIGFREAFLVFSRRLHHVGNTAIIAANIIDRSIYIVLLLILMVIIFATHARDQFKIKPEDKKEA